MTRQTLSRWALLIGALALMFALQGCGGDDNGGLSAADMARIDAAEAAAAAAQAEADAAQAAADEAKAEAEAAKMAADEAMTDMEGDMPADGGTSLADLYEDLAGMAIEADLMARLPEEGPISTTDLKAAIMATAEEYHLADDAAAMAIAYIEEKHSTYEVLQRAEAEDIIMALHMGGYLAATREAAMMVLTGPQGPQGDTGDVSDDVAMDLQNQIDQKADKADPIVPPMPEGAKVIQTGGLSSMAADYDPGMIMDPDTNTGASAAKGTYTGNADIGFAGLNALQAGGDGADVFGSWLKYSHWGYVMAEDGSMGTFSLGMPSDANPMPQDSDKTTATWTGLMTGAWQATEMRAAAAPNTTAAVLAPANQGFETVRGDATITVTFSSAGPASTSSAALSITNLRQADGVRLGNFRPGQVALDGGAGVAQGALITTVGSEASADVGYTEVWQNMAIMAGDFSRRGFSVTNPTTATAIPAANRDPNGPANYLAGRFYGMAGMEAGGVFMEDGKVSGMNGNVADGFGAGATGLSAAGVAGNTNAVTDLKGVLVGAFGGARDIPIQP